jgi:hypothetical protein
MARLADRWRADTAVAPDAPWYVRRKAELGAYATLLGVELTLHEDVARCQLASVGDTNAFVLRKRRLARTFPATASSAFSSFPDLIGTAKLTRGDAWRQTWCVLHRDDVLLLCTDAAAAHLLKLEELGRPAWSGLLVAVRRKSSFESWVKVARTEGMADDDTSVVVLRRSA